jgi:two-component system, cell cycle sensor histidine kinase and response regulator CckA
MPSRVSRAVVEPVLVLAVAVLAAWVFQGEQSFPVLLAIFFPSGLLCAFLIRRLTGPAVPPAAVRLTEARLQEIVRQNEVLTQELLESRMLDEAAELQGRAFEAFLQGVTITDPTRPGNPIVYANEGFWRLTGYGREEVMGRNPRFLQGKDTSPEAVAKIRDAIRQAKPCMVEIQNYRKDGTPFWNALSIAPIFEDGQLTHFVGVQTDITAFKTMEVQLRQSQKMEAIGHLAGGVAHDFNNLLTVINGCCELLQTGMDLPPEATPLIEEVHKAGERAATLTRQLLAFSRKTVLQPRVVSMNELVSDFERMLGRLIGEDVTMQLKLTEAAALVRIDAGQLEQALMNLVVNARDAMPKGGEVTIETKELVFDETTALKHPDRKPGRYVQLAVTDTGHGMDAKTKAHIFEPFFTTKPVGRGTGLGLATVYGIVQQSQGHIEVESELNQGTTFRLYFPAVLEGARSPGSFHGTTLPGGKETVLIVEDEAGVRGLAKQALEAHGYKVLAAANGEDALARCRNHGGDLDVILCDVVMPRMSGRELEEEIRGQWPDTRFIFMSGYTDDAMVRHGVARAESDFLQKPFTISGLLRKIREVLDRAPADVQPVLVSEPLGERLSVC